MKTTIPFTGFYESSHIEYIDDLLEHECLDSQCNINEKLLTNLQANFDYEHACIAYAKVYTRYFSETFKIPLDFETLSRPKEYNFETDRIFCEIETSTFLKLFNNVDKKRFSEYCKENFTTRSGFSSFYDPDWITWGTPDTWDINQVGALVECSIDQDEYDKFSEYFDNDDFKTDISGVVEDHTPQRLSKLTNYLYQRSER